ncbi:MAG: glycosyltransferase, partial [Pseudomonadales bacterium]|nr:glycosyltransferase [Pseudomonadales bacterium]
MKVSIITPSYNQAPFLQRTIESVAMQRYSDYEHIIFDGGSTDESASIAGDYASNDDRVAFTSEHDRGQAHAINKGFARAQGDILAWLNSDDYYYDENVISAVVEFFESHPEADVVYGRGLRVDGAGEVLSEAFVHPEGTDFQVSLQHSLGLLQPAVFFRRKVYEAVGGLSEDYNLQLDYEFWIRVAQSGFRFVFLDQVLANAVVHEDAKSTAQRREQLGECLDLVNEKFGYVPIQWISRYAEFILSGQDPKMAKIELSPPKVEEKQQIERFLLERYNANDGDMQTIASQKEKTTFAETFNPLKAA